MRVAPGRTVSIGGVVAMIVFALAACDDPSATEPDASVDGLGPIRTTPVIMSLVPGEARPLPLDLAGGVTLVTAPMHGEVVASGGTIRHAGGPRVPFVERVRATSVDDPNLTVELVLAVGGQVFLGTINGDAGVAGNWDIAPSLPVPTPWVFVDEAPAATIPIATVRSADVLVDGATLVVDELGVTGARFTARDATLLPFPDVARPAVTVTDGTVDGDLPFLIARGAVRLAGDVECERLIVHPGGTITVDSGRELAAFGDTFITAGGTLVIDDGQFHSGSYASVAGTLRTTRAASMLRVNRLDATDTGTIALTAGSFFLQTGDLTAARAFTVADAVETELFGATTTIALAASHSFARIHLTGTLDFIAAPLRARGPLTIAGGIRGEVIAEAGTTATGGGGFARLVTTTLLLQRDLLVHDLVASGDVTVQPTRWLSFNPGDRGTIGGDLHVDGTLNNFGTLTITGTLSFGPNGRINQPGTLVFGACESNGVPNAPPCP